MKYILVQAHHESVAPYLGFGAEIVGMGARPDSGPRTVVKVPDQHAQYLSDRLTSGMHWNRIFETQAEAIDGSVTP